MTSPYLLSAIDKKSFPDVERALTEPDGLLAIGGDLSLERLHSAYQQGIFPWYSAGQPILWWSPDPRMVLYPQDIKISRSLARKIRAKNYQITFDQAFHNVILACSEPRLIQGKQQKSTWILDEMIDAYISFHAAGYAHSVEYWQNGELLGGLYGVAMGKVFFGESMFSLVSDASKVASVYLCRQLEKWDYEFVDCQVYSSHLESLGAKMISRKLFIRNLHRYASVNVQADVGKWTADSDLTEYVLDIMK